MKRIFCFLCAAALLSGCAERESGLRGIANGADFRAFARMVNAGGSTARWQDSAGVVRLLRDVDLARGGNWTPVGVDEVNPFAGTFDGGGHVISGLRVVSDSLCVGLFGRNRGVIRNVIIGEECRIRGGNEHGFAGAVCGENHGLVEGCVSRAKVSGAGCVGGISGRVIAEIRGREPAVRGCVNEGEVTSRGSQAGGIVGWAYRALVDSCVNLGAVSCEGWFAGGVCGVSGACLTNCENRGAVTCAHFAGGIVGSNGEEGIVLTSRNGGSAAGEVAGGIAGERMDGSVIDGCSNDGTPGRTVGQEFDAGQQHEHPAACGHEHPAACGHEHHGH